MTATAPKGAEAQVQRQVQKFRGAVRGVFPRHCPICGFRGAFSAFGHPPRYDARCGGCGALERHRLIYLYITRRGFFDSGHAVLHFAPEVQLTGPIRELSGRYETADLSPSRKVTHHVDIEATGLPGSSFDRVVCNHVLEHVDDARALAEIRRLLVPGGRALISTPVVEGWAATYENSEARTAEERLLHFGQADHVRIYGRDIRDRIRAAGFRLTEFTAVEPDVRDHGLMRGETLFIATKPAGAAEERE